MQNLRELYLQVPVFAFDTETDTDNYHWAETASDPKRGLSISADFFAISFYADGLDPLVLFADKSTEYRDVDYMNKDTFMVISRAQEFSVYRFNDEDTAFIKEMFNYDRKVTIVGHNLVFDVRQVFVKLGIRVSPNHVYYDTLVMNNLLSGADKSMLVDDYEDEFADYEVDESKGAGLENLAGHFLSAEIHSWWKAMKAFRVRLTPIVYDYDMTNNYLEPDQVHPLLFANGLYEMTTVRKRGSKEDHPKYKVSYHDVYMYAALDSEMAYKLYMSQLRVPNYTMESSVFANRDLSELIAIDLDYIRLCCDMSVRGSRVDQDYLRGLRSEYAAKIEHTLNKMSLTPDIFHTNSVMSAYFTDAWKAVLRSRQAEFEAKVEAYAKNMSKSFSTYIDCVLENPDLENAGRKEANKMTYLIKKSMYCFLEGKTEIEANESNYHDRVATLRSWMANLDNIGNPVRYLILLAVVGIIKTNDERRFKLLTDKGNVSYSGTSAMYYQTFIPEMEDFAYLTELYSKLRRINEFLRHAEYNGRVHSILARTAVTGRNTSSSPNLQNLQMQRKKRSLPNYADVALDIGFMIPDENFKYIELDFSNAENWIAAMYAKDHVLARACSSDDFHAVMASTVYYPEQWKDADKATRKKLRNDGKGVTFGTAYGMGAASLALSLGISYEESKQLIDNKEKGFVAVRSAKERASNFATKNGYTALWTGRRIKIRYDAKGKLKAYTAWNTLAQGGVGEITTRAMLAIYDFLRDNGYKSYIANQVHDAIIIAMHKDEYELIAQTLIEIMSTIVPKEWNERTSPAVRWLVDIDHIANSKKWGWQFGKEYELPTDHYLNRWGKHSYGSTPEAKVWINEFGYGESAINAELSLNKVPEAKVEVDEHTYSLEDLYAVCKKFIHLMEEPFEFDGNTFVGKDAYLLKKTLRLNGIDAKPHLQYTEIFDSIARITKGVTE